MGYSFTSQPRACFCGLNPCPHGDFTGESKRRTVVPCTQQKADREQARDFFQTIKEGTKLASKGDLDDKTSDHEPLWISIAKGTFQTALAPFKAAGGTGQSGTRTIATNWSFVDIDWLVKIKTDSEGNVHYERWTQPAGERTVLTKPKILTIAFEWAQCTDALCDACD